jgi:uncharacterized protein
VTSSGTTREWPDQSVTRAAQTDELWRPFPFREFIFKIHSRCNLACDYCYMYELADQSWRSRPRIMSRQTIDRAADRIAEHANRHELDRVDVLFHGGEPLLAGPELIDYAARALRTAMPDREVGLSIQTNAIQLDDAVLAVLHRHRFGIGVSLDGGQEATDRHRRYANGKGSYLDTVAGLSRLAASPARSLFTGLLCTVNLANDPVRVFEDLLSLAPPSVDFLLPHSNWTEPPPRPAGITSATPYGDWLIAIFDRWYEAPAIEVGVRFFQEIMNLILGGSSGTEAIGLSPVQTLVIETDGSLEQVDSLKSAFNGAPATGHDISSAPFDVLLTHPAIVARQRGISALCATCRSCPLVSVCGGGHYVHRYRAGSGFLNPSVYCADLQRLIIHIRDRMAVDIPESWREYKDDHESRDLCG